MKGATCSKSSLFASKLKSLKKKGRDKYPSEARKNSI
jgi:hypothetical protein